MSALLLHVLGAVFLVGGSALLLFAYWRRDRPEDLGHVSPGYRSRLRLRLDEDERRAR